MQQSSPVHHNQQQPRWLQQLLFTAVLLAIFFLAVPAAAHSHRHTQPGRALHAANRTAKTVFDCGKPLPSDVKQLIRDKIAAVNAAAAAEPHAAAATGRVGIAAASMPGLQRLQRAPSITMGLVFHVIADPNVQEWVDVNQNGVEDAGETFYTAAHRARAANPGDLPTCGHLSGKLPCFAPI
jgi:hypothetical protein